MDDKTEVVVETEAKLSEDNQAKKSSDFLKKAKPSTNIALETALSPDAKEESTPISEETGTSSQKGDASLPSSPAQIETLFEKKLESHDSDVISNEIKTEKLSEKSVQSQIKTQSDIFSLKNIRNPTSTIFSVRGVPSRKPFKRYEPTLLIPPVENDKSGGESEVKEKSSEHFRKEQVTSQSRNPVTGIGVSSNDEFLTKPPKKRGGNPVLGLGYDDDNKSSKSQSSTNASAGRSNSSSNHRIPPGGYSQGLW